MAARLVRSGTRSLRRPRYGGRSRGRFAETVGIRNQLVVPQGPGPQPGPSHFQGSAPALCRSQRGESRLRRSMVADGSKPPNRFYRRPQRQPSGRRPAVAHQTFALNGRCFFEPHALYQGKGEAASSANSAASCSGLTTGREPTHRSSEQANAGCADDPDSTGGRRARRDRGAAHRGSTHPPTPRRFVPQEPEIQNLTLCCLCFLLLMHFTGGRRRSPGCAGILCELCGLLIKRKPDVVPPLSHARPAPVLTPSRQSDARRSPARARWPRAGRRRRRS